MNGFFTPKRRATMVGMVIAMAWTFWLLTGGRAAAEGMTPSAGLLDVLVIVAALLGLMLCAMVVRVGMRRFLSTEYADGQPFPTGSPGSVDARVLSNSSEQVMIAAVIWPALGLVVGAPVVLALALGFLVARGLFWIGYHYNPWLRATAFAMTLYPSVAAGVWALTAALGRV